MDRIGTTGTPRRPTEHLHAPRKVDEPKDVKGKDTKKAGSSESCCTRVWNVVKNALIAVVYYITCCQLDLSKNKRLFKDVADFSCVEKLPDEKDGEAKKAFTKQVTEQVTAAVKLVHKDDKALTYFADERVIAEIRNTLEAAFKAGLNPLEYRITLVDREIKVELFAPEDFDTKKATPFKASQKEYKAVVVAGNWAKGDVPVTLGEGKDAKKTKVACQSCTVSFVRANVPLNDTEQKQQAEVVAARRQQEEVAAARRQQEEVAAARRQQEEDYQQYTTRAMTRFADTIKTEVAKISQVPLTSESTKVVARILARVTDMLSSDRSLQIANIFGSAPAQFQIFRDGQPVIGDDGQQKFNILDNLCISISFKDGQKPLKEFCIAVAKMIDEELGHAKQTVQVNYYRQRVDAGQPKQIWANSYAPADHLRHGAFEITLDPSAFQQPSA